MYTVGAGVLTGWMAEEGAGGAVGRVWPHTPQNLAFGRGGAPQWGQEEVMVKF
jgi:hypothetical protein